MDESKSQPVCEASLMAIFIFRKYVMQYISGRVERYRRFSNDFILIRLKSADLQSVTKTLAYRGPYLRLRRGDTVSCYAQKKEHSAGIDYVCETLTIYAKTRSSRGKADPVEELPSGKSLSELEMLHVRSVFEHALCQAAGHYDYLPVRSPTLVNSWPDGNTPPFRLNFYDFPGRLTISNMIYHQMMLANGFSKVYEAGKLFRKENPSSARRLAEFTIFGVAVKTQDLATVMQDLEKIILHGFNALKAYSYDHVHLPDGFRFDTVTFDDLLARSGLTEIDGAQLPLKCRQYLDEHYDSFVWVTGFPEITRPFYIRSDGSRCEDCQLWFRGRIYVAAGGMVENVSARYRERMLARGQNPDAFHEYLKYVETGMPETGQIDFGVERLLAAVIGSSQAADYTWFPRYQNICMQP